MTFQDGGWSPWSPYVQWAKESPPARYDLAGSNLLHCTLDDLKGARDVLEGFGRPSPTGPTLVEAIAQRFGMGRDRVATGAGASGAYFQTLGALLEPGDAVLVEWPGYDPHAGAARLLGAEVRTFSRDVSEAFQVSADTLARHLTTGVKAIVLTNLHNPSGVYTDPWILMEAAEVARAVGAKIIVDEVYLEAVSGIDTTPAAGRHDAFVSVSSLSKAFGLAGLRIGWTLADPETVRRIRRVRDVVDGVGSAPMERLGVLAFQKVDTLLARARRILDPNSWLLKRFVETRPELDWVAPADGSPVAFPRLVGVEDAGPFVEAALLEHGVKVVPGRFFGPPDHFRVSISGRKRELEDGLEALGKALDRGWG